MSHRAYVLKTGQITREGAGQVLLEDPSIQHEYLGVQQFEDEDISAEARE
jgi:ABC-type branched-subunit amino acid transport system ATPase component